jgi:hypothetical protein
MRILFLIHSRLDCYLLARESMFAIVHGSLLLMSHTGVGDLLDSRRTGGNVLQISCVHHLGIVQLRYGKSFLCSLNSCYSSLR